MSGAGGGGFVFVLTKEPNMVDEVKAVIKKMKVESCFCASIAHVKFTNILFQFPIGLQTGEERIVKEIKTIVISGSFQVSVT